MEQQDGSQRMLLYAQQRNKGLNLGEPLQVGNVRTAEIAALTKHHGELEALPRLVIR